MKELDFRVNCPQCLEKTIPVGFMASFLNGIYPCDNCGFSKGDKV